jgi:hypothetical protein
LDLPALLRPAGQKARQMLASQTTKTDARQQGGQSQWNSPVERQDVHEALSIYQPQNNTARLFRTGLQRNLMFPKSF